MGIIQVSAPQAEPITAESVKQSARIDGSEFDSQLAIIIPALRRQAEGHLGRRLINQTLRLMIDRFPAIEIDLQLPDVTSIVSVQYIDQAGVLQTLPSNAYVLDSASTTAWLLPAAGVAWPETMASANAVRIDFVAGYGDAPGDVPEDIRLWMIAHAVQILNAPDGQGDGSIKPLPFVDGLLDYYKIWRVV